MAHGFRTDNPATKDLLQALPKNGVQVDSFKAVHHSEIEEVMRGLREIGVMNKRQRPIVDALDWLVLSATRSNETRGARWSEIELCNETGKPLWVIPSERMKTGKEHRVPLTPVMENVMHRAWTYADKDAPDAFMFPGSKGRPMGQSTFPKFLRRVGVDGTPHGMRSTFMDWCAEEGVEREVREACLAHIVGGVEGAYFRSTLLERRREVMEAWSEYVAGTETPVDVPQDFPSHLRFVA